MKLTLIRHGETEANARRLYYGSTDIPLSPEGIEKLEALKSTVTYPNADRYYTSGMLRTEQTLAILYGEIPHTAVSDLGEMDFGKFEMHSYEELKDDPDYIAWISGDFEGNVTPGGESARMQAKRVLSALDVIIARGEDAVVVCHGGTIACAMLEWFDFSSRYECTPKPGLGFIVEISADKSKIFTNLT